MIIIQLLKDTKKSAKHQTVIDNSLDNYAIAKDFFSALGLSSGRAILDALRADLLNDNLSEERSRAEPGGLC